MPEVLGVPHIYLKTKSKIELRHELPSDVLIYYYRVIQV